MQVLYNIHHSFSKIRHLYIIFRVMETFRKDCHVYNHCATNKNRSRMHAQLEWRKLYTLNNYCLFLCKFFRNTVNRDNELTVSWLMSSVYIFSNSKTFFLPRTIEQVTLSSPSNSGHTCHSHHSDNDRTHECFHTAPEPIQIDTHRVISIIFFIWRRFFH